MYDIPDVTAKAWQSVCLSKYRELLDYFGKKIPISRFTGFPEKSFFLKKKKSEIGIKSIGSDAFALNFSKKWDSTDCSMRVLERLDFSGGVM